jgi:hypothetical protein
MAASLVPSAGQAQRAARNSARKTSAAALAARRDAQVAMGRADARGRPVACPHWHTLVWLEDDLAACEPHEAAGTACARLVWLFSRQASGHGIEAERALRGDWNAAARRLADRLLWLRTTVGERAQAAPAGSAGESRAA